jgi:hypothetical protein
MLHGLTPFLSLPPKHERPLRIQIFTECVPTSSLCRYSISHLSFFLLRRAESMIAPYLTALQERLKPHGIQIGSYPVLSKGVFVSLIGRDLNNGTKKIWLADVAREVEKEVGGRVVSEEEVAAQKKASEQLNNAGASVSTEPPEKLVKNSKTKP